jgi:hypothetical protein
MQNSHIKDTVCDDFSINAEYVGAFGQGKDNGVCSPKASLISIFAFSGSMTPTARSSQQARNIDP